MRADDTALPVQAQQSKLFDTKSPVTDNPPMTLGERIKQARERAGLSQAALAQAAGIRQQTLSALEAGRASSTRSIVPLAEALGVSASWLERGTPEARENLGPPRNQSETDNSWTDSGRTPSGDLVYRSLDEWLKSQGVNPSSMHVWMQRGAAMEPTLHEGDSVAVELGDHTIVDGAIYAIEMAAKIRLRRLRETSGGDLVVTSDNPDKTRFPDEIIPFERRSDVFVIGRAIYRAGPLK
ncbi:helix-turn-helix domain-containing protein [Luteibacter sp. PPL552]